MAAGAGRLCDPAARGRVEGSRETESVIVKEAEGRGHAAIARKEDFRRASMIADHRSAAHTLVLLPYWHRRPDAQTHRLLRDSAVLQIARGAFAMIDCFEPRTDLPQLVATEFTALGVWPGSDLWSQVRQAVTKLCGPGPCPVSVDVHSTEITPAASLRPILPDGEPI